jgi:hypothetical protein
MESINQFLIGLKALAPYSIALSSIILSLALLVGFIAVCLLAVKGKK